VDVSGEQGVDAGAVQEHLHGVLHGGAFPLVRLVDVVPRRVHKREHEHRRPAAAAAAVERREVGAEPPLLCASGAVVSVGAEHDDVHGATDDVEGVVEVVARRWRGTGAVGDGDVVGHAPPHVVGLERLRLHQRQLLDLVIALRRHPRPRTRHGRLALAGHRVNGLGR